MNPTTLFRIASVAFALFAAGHTYGFLTFKPSSVGGLAAQQAMKNATFPIGGSTFTFGGFYVGFGLSITVQLLFAAVLAWAFFAFQLLGVATACRISPCRGWCRGQYWRPSWAGPRGC